MDWMDLIKKKLSRNKLEWLRLSNYVALFMSVVTVVACFTGNSWLFLILLSISVGYLVKITHRFIMMSNDSCVSEFRTISYDRQVATLQIRLSAIANSMAIAVSVTFITMELVQIISKQPIITNTLVSDYVLGFARLVLFYIVADKIHGSRVLINALKTMGERLRHLVIGNVVDLGENIWPTIYVDGSKLSDKRYCVAVCDNELVVVFTPALSVDDNSVVEYELTKPDDRETMFDQVICEEVELNLSHCKCTNVVVMKRG